jgi:CDP-diacylglycerol--glycerol-3-phosphate 3-phosphatidyltransferase
MSESPATVRLTSLPNLLGLARILATPVVMFLLLRPFAAAGAIAFVIFTVAASTDWFDGRIARARGQVTPLGIFMDLTADKVLVAGILIAMVDVDLLPAWMVATLIIRELVVQGVRQLAASASVVIPARGLGKWKAFGTNLAIGALLLAFDADTGGPLASLGVAPLLHLAGAFLALMAVLLAVASAWDYLRGALPILMGRDK